MDGIDSTLVESPSGAITPGAEYPANVDFDNFETYVNSVPYLCESSEEMEMQLELIIEKFTICCQTRDWRSLTTWSAMLQCWMTLKYPLPKPTRITLVELCYELVLMPGADPTLVRGWADLLQRLIAEKPGGRRKVEASDLTLDWKPLWRNLQRELWPKKNNNASTRNMVNLLLFVAEKCRRYFGAHEINPMLDTFLPLFTKDTSIIIMSVMISFLPPTHCHLYLDVIFKLWEATNSYMVDDRVIELLGALAEEHVAGKAGPAGPEGGAAWKDVGIFTDAEWTILVGKCLGSFHVPVASMKGASNTGIFADTQATRAASKLKKTTNRLQSLSQVFVYSISVDGVSRDEDPSADGAFLAGSKALDALDRLIMSTESFFHPSNSGPWTLSLITFVKDVISEFLNRWKDENSSLCKTPVTQRLTPTIRRSIVILLRTPCLLAMFAKDLLAAGFAQMSLKTLAMLDPDLIMPQVIEKGVGGLEVVNETHRTTAVLSALAMVAYPLVNENVWSGGQKHLLTLLELALPGFDMNDPHKTMVTALFISTVASQIRLGVASGSPTVGSSEPMLEGEPNSSTAEEKQIVRDATFQFEEWVASFFRQVFRLYENLPEEGGRSNKAGGKTEESMLAAIKTALDMVCQHLSSEIYDMVLRQTYEYATTNAKPNAVRAFGQLISSLARVHPDRALKLFLPLCVTRLEEELLHGASSIRTTSVHPANPADTVFHWYLTILRACLGYGGHSILKFKDDIISVLKLLVTQSKNERGYSGVGRLLTRLLHNIGGVYTMEERFVNEDEWDNSDLEYDHPALWGRFYDAHSAKLNWHVPTSEETNFVIEILDAIAILCLNPLEPLVTTVDKWDNVARNDFCRYTLMLRSIWNALSTFVQLPSASVPRQSFDDTVDLPELLFPRLHVKAGFTLVDAADPRYEKVLAHRLRFGNLLHNAATALRLSVGEDHIDAVIQVCKGMDVYLLEYAITRAAYSATAKAYQSRREGHRIWLKQKAFPRNVFVKRAQYYHHGRLYLHSLYRGRTEQDDALLQDLVEMSLSPYTRVRKYAQNVLFTACSSYARSTRSCFPKLLEALKSGTDADRMKGALYTLGNKAIVSYAMADSVFMEKYLVALLRSAHQDKTSIQDLVKGVVSDCVSVFSEEALSSNCKALNTDRFAQLLSDLRSNMRLIRLDLQLLKRAEDSNVVREQRKEELYDSIINGIVAIAQQPGTHWKYVQYAVRLLLATLRRDKAPTSEVAELLMESICSPESATRSYSQRAVTQILLGIKRRTWSSGSHNALWLEEYMNPLARPLSPSEFKVFIANLKEPDHQKQNYYVDKIPTGYLVWSSTLKAYSEPPQDQSPFQWESNSEPVLKAMQHKLASHDWLKRVSVLWSQESNRTNSNADLRSEHFTLIKLLVKICGEEALEQALELIEPLCLDPDRFKQRAGVEILLGLTRGAKHWPQTQQVKVSQWLMSRIPKFFNLIKPDTRNLWESYFCLQLIDWDPRRMQPLVDWILSLPLEFKGDSAFSMGKTLSLFSTTAENLGPRFQGDSTAYLNLLFDNADNAFAEIREQIAHGIDILLKTKAPSCFSSTEHFVKACQDGVDPLGLRRAPSVSHINDFALRLPKLKEQRLPPPRVSQSEYDRTGMTLLQWLWNSAHSPHAPALFPYVLPLIPEFFQMSELNDNGELVKYSMAVLFVLSSITPLSDFVEPISSCFIQVIQSSQSWRVRQNALPVLLVFFYRNLAAFSDTAISRIVDTLIECLQDENVEVRNTAAKVFAGILRCSQRSKIPALRQRFIVLEEKVIVPKKSDVGYNVALRHLHSAILGLCALMDCFPYVVENWMPPLMEVFSRHSTDPPPISTTIRTMASDFKKTHQDTWHVDQFAFTEDELQALNTILVGTSYYA